MNNRIAQVPTKPLWCRMFYPLATEQVEIDLDDGVKVNYNKFGAALKKIAGLSGK